MDFNAEEQKIREMMEPYKSKKVPDALMKNYVEEVRRKVAKPDAFPFFPVMMLTLVIAVSGFLVFVLRPAMKPTSVKVVPAPIVRTEIKQPAAKVFVAQEKTSSQTPADSSRNDANYDKLAQEIFILDMLGEDTGIDDPSRVQSDLNFIGG